jgi:hypothetical protein
MTLKKDADDFDVLIDPPSPFQPATLLREFLKRLNKGPDSESARRVKAEYTKYLAQAEAREAVAKKG